MANLRSVTVAFDSYILLRVSKETALPTSVQLLRHLNPVSKVEFMKVVAVDKTEVTVKVEMFKQNPAQTNIKHSNTWSIRSGCSEQRMLVWGAEIAVMLEKHEDLRKGLWKATKKPVPEKCRFQLVYVSCNIEYITNDTNVLRV
jgi:hypothetical protein